MASENPLPSISKKGNAPIVNQGQTVLERYGADYDATSGNENPKEIVR